jgi:hypothetical protein
MSIISQDIYLNMHGETGERWRGRGEERKGEGEERTFHVMYTYISLRIQYIS